MTLQLTALGHSITAWKESDTLVNLRVDGNDMELDNVRVVGDTLTGQVSVMFVTAAVVVVVKDHEIDVTISHSWLADGKHVVKVDAAHVAAVRQFMKEFP